LLSEFSIHYDMFRPSWPHSGNTQYIQNTLEDRELLSSKHVWRNEYYILHKIEIQL